MEKPYDKREWKKEEKGLYLPKAAPTVLEVPAMHFFVLEGQGNPNGEAFAQAVEALYAASYAVRMSHKGKAVPPGYYEYTVYPLEGVWDLTEKGRALQAAGGKDEGVAGLKDELVFKLMIRQPSFLTPELADGFIAAASEKKKSPRILDIRFEAFQEGLCVQMLHEGSYDLEPASFKRMAAFCEAEGLKRLSLTHREIYLSDARKTAPEALKTVLRFQVAR